MAEHMTTPKLVMGHIEVVAPDGEEGIPYDEAVIHLEGDEDSEIEVHCPGALRFAPFIVEAVNSHGILVAALQKIAEGAPETEPDRGDYDFSNSGDVTDYGIALEHFAQAKIAREALQRIAESA